MKVLKVTRFLLLGLIPLVIAGCSAVEESYYKLLGNDTYRPTVCPRLSILADASELTRYKPGPGRDIIDTTVEGVISGVDVKCGYELEDDQSGVLNVSILLHFEATVGPANQTNKAQLAYFLAVLDQNKKVLKRETFPFEVHFPGNVVKSSFRDEPVQFILPIKRGEDGSIFEIYAGFQLTPEEVEFNRRKKSR